LFSEFTDAVIVFIVLQTLLSIALGRQFAVMKLSRNVFLGYTKDFFFKMKRIAFFIQVNLGLKK
jgi:hypothetical protein